MDFEALQNVVLDTINLILICNILKSINKRQKRRYWSNYWVSRRRQEKDLHYLAYNKLIENYLKKFWEST